MYREVTISSVTANTPVDIYYCDSVSANCQYVSTVMTFPYTFQVPPPYTDVDIVVKIVDTEGCIDGGVILITPTPTPSLTPTLTPSPTTTSVPTSTPTNTPAFTPTPTVTSTLTPVPTRTPTTTPTLTTTLTMTPTQPVIQAGLSNFGPSDACANFSINPVYLYSDCSVGSLGIGCYLYYGPGNINPINSQYVKINNGNFDINVSNGQILNFSTIQC